MLLVEMLLVFCFFAICVMLRGVWLNNRLAKAEFEKSEQHINEAAKLFSTRDKDDGTPYKDKAEKVLNRYIGACIFFETANDYNRRVIFYLAGLACTLVIFIPLLCIFVLKILYKGNIFGWV